MRIFKLIVMDSKNCTEIVRYFLKHVKTINSMGIKIDTILLEKDKLTRPFLNTLKENGIVSLPVVITDQGKKIIGVKNITKLFNNNIQEFTSTIQYNKVTEAVQPAPQKNNSSRGASITDYYKRLITEDDSTDAMIGESKTADYNSKMKEASQRRDAMHKQYKGNKFAKASGEATGQNNDADDDDGPMNIAPPRDNIRPDDTNDDLNGNMQHTTKDTSTNESRSGDLLKSLEKVTDNDKDDDMLDAWMKNNMGGGGDW